MKIAVVCLASRTGGGLTILQDLHHFASETDSANEWLFVLSDQDLGQSTDDVQLLQTAPNYSGWASRIGAELTVARHAINQFDPDVVLSLQNMDTPGRGRRPLAIYMHQPLPFVDTRFSLFKGSERNFALRQIVQGALIRASIRRAEVTFVQTEWIADAVRQACPKARVENVGYQMPEELDEKPLTRSETTGFVYPASGAIYKDHATLHDGVKLWREQCSDPGKVVITLTREKFASLVGGLSDEESEWYEFVGHVSPAVLKEIYARSMLVFPSYVETLGLPLYEAQAARCWIVAADTPPTREALAAYPAAYLFAPRSPNDLARAMGEAWEVRDQEVDHLDALKESDTSAQSPWQIMLDELAVFVAKEGSNDARHESAFADQIASKRQWLRRESVSR